MADFGRGLASFGGQSTCRGFISNCQIRGEEALQGSVSYSSTGDCRALPLATLLRRWHWALSCYGLAINEANAHEGAKASRIAASACRAAVASAQAVGLIARRGDQRVPAGLLIGLGLGLLSGNLKKIKTVTVMKNDLFFLMVDVVHICNYLAGIIDSRLLFIY